STGRRLSLPQLLFRRLVAAAVVMVATELWAASIGIVLYPCHLAQIGKSSPSQGPKLRGANAMPMKRSSSSACMSRRTLVVGAEPVVCPIEAEDEVMGHGGQACASSRSEVAESVSFQ